MFEEIGNNCKCLMLPFATLRCLFLSANRIFNLGEISLRITEWTELCIACFDVMQLSCMHLSVCLRSTVAWETTVC